MDTEEGVEVWVSELLPVKKITGLSVAGYFSCKDYKPVLYLKNDLISVEKIEQKFFQQHQ